MAAQALPTPEVLRQLLRYEPETGKLFWKHRHPDVFADAESGRSRSHISANWNARYAGKQALTAVSPRGYLSGSIFCRTITAHRVAWTIQSGAWPVKQIDHINGDRTDNRIQNLREATPRDNSRNRGIGQRNTSGVMGVSWDSGKLRWRAFIKANGRAITLGRFSFLDDAVAARKSAEIEFGYHPNHGRG